MDLDTASALIKPAILYADRVTLYSPAASMLQALHELEGVTDSQGQLATILELARTVPALGEQFDGFDAETLATFQSFLTADRSLMLALGDASGCGAELAAIYGQIDELSAQWQAQIPGAMAQSAAAIGGEELRAALKAGVVEVAPLVGGNHLGLVGSSLRAATGGDESDLTDDLLHSWLGELLQMLRDPSSFPLLDAASAGLVRALEGVERVDVNSEALRRSSEVTAASQFVEYMPYFAQMPLDEVLDLRRELQAPLARFRSEMVKISRDFRSRPIDPVFMQEVEDAWRERVAPALAEVRELLAEHGLLREAASVIRGDFRRLAAEAGGVFAVANLPALDLSALLAAGLGTALAGTDTMLRAVNETRRALSQAQSNAFYFLHRVAEAADRHAP